MIHIAMDNDLVKKLKMGDIEAFDKLFNKYAGKLFAFAFKYLKSKEDTEGLVQNVFLKIWENRRNLKTDTSFKSFLFTIAYHEMCNVFRHRNYQQKVNENLTRQTSSSATTVEDNLDFKIALDKVDKLILELPETQRNVFIKSKKDGLTSRQIAKELNISSKTVDNYISMTLKFLKTRLKTEIMILFILTFTKF